MRCWNHPTVTPTATRTVSGFLSMAHGAINAATPPYSAGSCEVLRSGSIGVASNYHSGHGPASQSANPGPGAGAGFGTWRPASKLALGPPPSAVPCARLPAKPGFTGDVCGITRRHTSPDAGEDDRLPTTLRARLVVSSHRRMWPYARRRGRGLRHPRTAIRSQAVIGYGRAARPSRDRGCLKSAGRGTTHEKHLTVVPAGEWRPPVGSVVQPCDLYAGVARLPRGHR
jgi:hypothetical protein